MKAKYPMFFLIILFVSACSDDNNNAANTGSGNSPRMPANAVPLTMNNGQAIIALVNPIQINLSDAADGFPEDIARGACANISGDDINFVDVGNTVYTYTNCPFLAYTLNGRLNFRFNESLTTTANIEHYILSGNITLQNSFDSLSLTDLYIEVNNQYTQSNVVSDLSIAFAVSSADFGGFVVTSSKQGELMIRGAGNSTIVYDRFASIPAQIDVAGNGVFVPLL